MSRSDEERLDVGAGEARSNHRLAPKEKALLLALMREQRFSNVARRIGYSERQARRLTQQVVERLGAATRYEALAIAIRERLI